MSVGHKLSRKLGGKTITIIEPSNDHYYQPGWTLVGGGIFNAEQTRRDERDLIPLGANWIRDRVIGYDPQNNSITTESNQKIKYDVLIVAAGIEMQFGVVKGIIIFLYYL